MGKISQILSGHFNEIMNKEDALHDYRMAICDKCPLCADSTYGKICSNRRYLNTKTNKASFFPCDSCINGCGCRLEAKTRVQEATCPAGKWDK